MVSMKGYKRLDTFANKAVTNPLSKRTTRKILSGYCNELACSKLFGVTYHASKSSQAFHSVIVTQPHLLRVSEWNTFVRTAKRTSRKLGTVTIDTH